MSEILKLKYKVGEIEFEAEGSAEEVEQQRINFMNAVLPAAVSAMVQTHNVAEQRTYIESTQETPLLEGENKDGSKQLYEPKVDYSRTNLAAFLKKYGPLTEQDFTLISAYFDEQKNGNRCFSIEDVKRYYSEARRPLPKNPSMSLNRLAEKGYIMDSDSESENKSGKLYMLSDDGISYINSYTPKKDCAEKKKSRTKAKKQSKNISDIIMAVTADDINASKYPAIKSFSGAKEQVILAMYIVVNERKSEWFTVDEVVHLLINVFEVPATCDKVNGVFKRNKSMFAHEKDEKNKKAYRYKLLSGAKDYADAIISSSQG